MGPEAWNQRSINFSRNFFLPICDFASDAEIVAIGEFARASAHAQAKPNAFAIPLMRTMLLHIGKELRNFLSKKWTCTMRFIVCSDHKQWGQSPSIEKTRAYRRYDLDLHTKISIWEIIRFEPGWVPKPEINGRWISAVIFFLPISPTLLWTPKSAQLANSPGPAGPMPRHTNAFAIQLNRYDVVAHWKRIAHFFVWKVNMHDEVQWAVIRNNGLNLLR